MSVGDPAQGNQEGVSKAFLCAQGEQDTEGWILKESFLFLPCVNVIRRVVQTSIRTVALNKRRVGSPWIVQHEVSPLNSHQFQCRIRIAGDEVSLKLEAACKWRDGRRRAGTFWGWGAIWTPTGLQVGGNGLCLGRVECQVAEYFVTSRLEVSVQLNCPKKIASKGAQIHLQSCSRLEAPW